MEGAEKYDFFRQPDFVPDPFLKGSYAVYKKETLLGEGTGKLCHIHRPLIIDALGRRVWGDLSIAGNSLFITIPEQWLAEAKYPVVVDPTVGTTTIGSQTMYYNEDNEDDYELFIEYHIAVNRFSLPEAFNGMATAYVYAYNTDYWGKCKPVLYSDSNNSPLTRRCTNEGLFDIEVNSGKPAGWRSAAFQTNTSISSGSYIWYGFLSEWFAPRFDYGTQLYWGWYNDATNPNANVPDTYPLAWSDTNYNFKLSMYFTWANAQNYVRTLTQGVTLTDANKQAAEYKRSNCLSVNASGDSKGAASFFRQCLINVSSSLAISRLPFFIRSAFDDVALTDIKTNYRDLSRLCNEAVNAESEINKSQGFIRSLADSLYGSDTVLYPVIFTRSISETQSITDTIKQWGNYVRGLYDEAGSMAETTRQGEFYRNESDTVQAEGSVFRGLLFFVKILTTSLVRDFILRRFLIAREELVLKSCITRELTLESKIN
jgi:hypothetical protein